MLKVKIKPGTLPSLLTEMTKYIISCIIEAVVREIKISERNRRCKLGKHIKR